MYVCMYVCMYVYIHLCKLCWGYCLWLLMMVCMITVHYIVLYGIVLHCGKTSHLLIK